MDFNDTPEEAAFRAEARAWLEANARPRTGGDDDWSTQRHHTDAESMRSCSSSSRSESPAANFATRTC